MYSFLADLTLVVHLGFVFLIVLGGFLVLRWRRAIWVHVPLALWGAAIMFFRWTCPLTPLENYFRRRAGEAGYEDSFIEEYLLPLLYPGELTRGIQIAMGVFVLAINALAYVLVWRKYRRPPVSEPTGS